MFLLSFVVNQEKKTCFPSKVVAHKTNHISYRCRSRRNRLLSSKARKLYFEQRKPSRAYFIGSLTNMATRYWNCCSILLAVREISRARFNFLNKLSPLKRKKNYKIITKKKLQWFSDYAIVYLLSEN